MKIRLFAFTVIIAIIMVVFLYFQFAFDNKRLHNKSYIQRITSVKLPAAIKVIQEFDNGEFIAGGKYQLDSASILPFLSQYKFSEFPYYTNLSLNAYLDKANKVDLKHSIGLLYLEGCKPGNSWFFVINPNTGELWISVEYPDMGGTAPTCDETSNRDIIKKRATLENKIFDTILSLPEVIEWGKYLKKETKGKRQLQLFIATEPDSVNAYYWVKAGEDNGDAFATHFNFFVYPDSMRIMYYDVVEDVEISLIDWRKRRDD